MNMEVTVFKKNEYSPSNHLFIDEEAAEKMSDWRRREYFSGRKALEYCLKEYLKEKDGSGNIWGLRVLSEKGKKPELKLPDRLKGFPISKVDFSISHSGNLSMCHLVEGGRAGADIEKTRSFENDLLEGFLSPREIRIVKSKKRLFKKRATLFWSLKEAYLKAIGTGLVKNPRELEIFSINGRYTLRNKDMFSCGTIRTGGFLNKFVWVTVSLK